MERLRGLDVARALALAGMMLVNYKLVFAAEEPALLLAFIQLFEGRAAAVFMVLAGIGIGLMSRKARESGGSRLRLSIAAAIVKRSMFLWGLGLVLYAVFDWSADILHYYGTFMLLLLPVLYWRPKPLWVLYAFVLMISTILQLALPYGQGWDFASLEYADFWTMNGFFRHLFYNGFHPVFPWFGFMVFGLALSHLRLSEAQVQRKLICWGAAIAILVELLSLWIQAGMGHNDAAVFAGTKPMPPGLPYMLAASAWAVCFIGCCLLLANHSEATGRLKPLMARLTAVGQMALTHYVIHSALVLGIVDAAGLLHPQTAYFTAGLTLGVYLLLLLGSQRWIRAYRRGPLELVMRKWSG